VIGNSDRLGTLQDSDWNLINTLITVDPAKKEMKVGVQGVQREG